MFFKGFYLAFPSEKLFQFTYGFGRIVIQIAHFLLSGIGRVAGKFTRVEYAHKLRCYVSWNAFLFHIERDVFFI